MYPQSISSLYRVELPHTFVKSTRQNPLLIENNKDIHTVFVSSESFRGGGVVSGSFNNIFFVLKRIGF